MNTPLLLEGEKFVVSWVHIIVSQGLVSDAFGDKEARSSLLALSCVNKSISHIVRHYIQNNFTFTIQVDDPTRFEKSKPKIERFEWYSPKRVQVSEDDDIDKLLDDIFPRFQITHLTMYNRLYFSATQFKIHLPLNKLPNTLTHLEFGIFFNQEIDSKLLPPNLKHLTFGFHYNYHINNLPNKITKLEFGSSFNRPVDNLLPSSIIDLKFVGKFCQSVDHLPPNLRSLMFGEMFNTHIDNLPPNLEKLTLGYRFNTPIDSLPQSLTHLTIQGCFNTAIDSLPQNITHLDISFIFNQAVDKLPLKITHLTLRGHFNQPVTKLPPLIKFLNFGIEFSQAIDLLPRNIKQLQLYAAYKHNHQYSFTKFQQLNPNTEIVQHNL